MPKLLLLSVSDGFAVYSRIIYFLIPLSRAGDSPKCLHVIPIPDICSRESGCGDFQLQIERTLTGQKSTRLWAC